MTEIKISTMLMTLHCRIGKNSEISKYIARGVRKWPIQIKANIEKIKRTRKKGIHYQGQQLATNICGSWENGQYCYVKKGNRLKKKIKDIQCYSITNNYLSM